MKATELRIGNWVEYNYLDLYEKKSRSTDTQIDSLLLISAETHPTKFNPIPLDEQWLKELGFEAQYIGDPRGFYSLSINDNLYFTVSYSSNQLTLHRKGYGVIEIFVNHKHVHQLQNLYFALTGKELIRNNLTVGTSD